MNLSLSYCIAPILLAHSDTYAISIALILNLQLRNPCLQTLKKFGFFYLV